MTALFIIFKIWNMPLEKNRANMNREFFISSLPAVSDMSGAFESKSPKVRNVLKPPLDKYEEQGWNLPPPFPIGSKLH